MPETLLESELFGYRKGAFTGANTNKKGLFEAANKGTIFLDEIGSIPLNMQMKLLRVLQEKEIRQVGGTEDIKIDVRVVAATNEDLAKKIKEQTFREDLFYRLSVIPIELPPLAERKEDIPQLVNYFIGQYNNDNARQIEISTQAIKLLIKHTWPGNVRELENTIKRAATLCDNSRIEVADLPGLDCGDDDVSSEPDFENINDERLSLKNYMKNVEISYMNAVIEECNGDKELAAEKLGVSIATLYRKINE
jgi:transcriptional regulator with PAS, ATPase and Fis domain